MLSLKIMTNHGGYTGLGAVVLFFDAENSEFQNPTESRKIRSPLVFSILLFSKKLRQLPFFFYAHRCREFPWLTYAYVVCSDEGKHQVNPFVAPFVIVTQRLV